MTLVRPGAVLFGVLACLLCSVTAAGASSSTPAAGGAFCSVSKGVATNLVNISKQIRSPSSPARLKAEWGAIMSASPSLKASAPASIKVSVVKVLAFAAVIDADLKKANWNVAGLLPYQSSLVAQDNKTEPSFTKLKAYYRGTCKFDV